MRRPSTGSLPSSRNSSTPIATVAASAISGEASTKVREGVGRVSSRSMAGLLRGVFGGGGVVAAVEQAGHPLADLLHRGLARGDRRRQAAARDHHQAVGELEQLV